jgi:hypothetical protein
LNHRDIRALRSCPGGITENDLHWAMNLEAHPAQPAPVAVQESIAPAAEEDMPARAIDRVDSAFGSVGAAPALYSSDITLDDPSMDASVLTIRPDVPVDTIGLPHTDMPAADQLAGLVIAANEILEAWAKYWVCKQCIPGTTRFGSWQDCYRHLEQYHTGLTILSPHMEPAKCELCNWLHQDIDAIVHCDSPICATGSGGKFVKTIWGQRARLQQIAVDSSSFDTNYMGTSFNSTTTTSGFLDSMPLDLWTFSPI